MQEKENPQRRRYDSKHPLIFYYACMCTCIKMRGGSDGEVVHKKMHIKARKEVSMNYSSFNTPRRQCPQCGGIQVQTTMMSTYRGESLKLVQPYRTVAFFKRRSSTSPMVYLTCLSCGLTSLYATQPNNLVPDKMER